MRILLDECVPRRLRREFVGHEVHTVRDMGWSGVKNGALIRLMETAGIEVLVTIDQNIPFQQNLAGSTVAIMVLTSAKNRLADLLPLVPSIHDSLRSIKPGEIVRITE